MPEPLGLIRGGADSPPRLPAVVAWGRGGGLSRNTLRKSAPRSFIVLPSRSLLCHSLRLCCDRGSSVPVSLWHRRLA